ncbi:hypothetical protein NL539_26095, partial [Aeromonas sp. CPF2-S1]|nr:hypothetical protein [Aeromonas sp. CPF2-S1]
MDLSRSRGVADRNIPSAMVFFHIITEKYQGYLTKNLQQCDNTISTTVKMSPNQSDHRPTLDQKWYDAA